MENNNKRQNQRLASRKHFKALVQLGCIWLPSEPQFREIMNEVAEAALAHFLKHGDTNKIKTFILSLPEDVDKLCVAEYFKKFAAITYDQKLNFRTDKSDGEKHKQLKSLREFNIFSVRKLLNMHVFDFGCDDEGTVQIHSKKITKSEFVQFILDGLVEKRRLFSHDDVEEISMILERIKPKAY